jgi:hypothetical protein
MQAEVQTLLSGGIFDGTIYEWGNKW